METVTAGETARIGGVDRHARKSLASVYGTVQMRLRPSVGEIDHRNRVAGSQPCPILYDRLEITHRGLQAPL